MTPRLLIPMKTNAKHELLRARAERNILILNPLMNNSSRATPKMNYLVLRVLQKEMLFVSRGSCGAVEGDVGRNILDMKIHLLLICGIVSEARAA